MDCIKHTRGRVHQQGNRPAWVECVERRVACRGAGPRAEHRVMVGIEQGLPQQRDDAHVRVRIVAAARVQADALIHVAALHRAARLPKAGVVILVHEDSGLTEWVRATADQLAKDGFIAMAPDLLSGNGPNGGGTDSLGAQASEVARTL